MQMIRRKIRLFFVSYGKLFLFVIGVFLGVTLFVQILNSMVIESNTEKYSSKEYQEQLNKDKNCITEFIDYCNEGKIEQAYQMLSEGCKKEKYSTIEEFEDKYIKRIFNIKICEYGIAIKGDSYIITLTQDVLITGKIDSTVETSCKVIDGVLEKSIYIIE